VYAVHLCSDLKGGVENVGVDGKIPRIWGLMARNKFGDRFASDLPVHSIATPSIRVMSFPISTWEVLSFQTRATRKAPRVLS
jgi:hypothetical protein